MAVAGHITESDWDEALEQHATDEPVEAAGVNVGVELLQSIRNG